MSDSNYQAENPYAPPTTSWYPIRRPRQNWIGALGFALSVAATVGLISVGPTGRFISTIGMYLTFLCLPGVLVSLVGIATRPRRLAAWGIGLGIFCSFYLPTFYLALFLSQRS